MKEIAYLPVFSGFYESIHSATIDMYEESFYSEDFEDYDAFIDAYDVDYNAIHNEYAKEFCEQLIESSEFKALSESTGITWTKYDSLYSPKYYNFSTDSIKCWVRVNKIKLSQFLKLEKESFSEYIKEHNTSYDGYMSYLPNTLSEYVEAIERDLTPAIITQISEYFIEKNWFDNLDYNTIDSMTAADSIVYDNIKDKES